MPLNYIFIFIFILASCDDWFFSYSPLTRGFFFVRQTFIPEKDVL